MKETKTFTTYKCDACGKEATPEELSPALEWVMRYGYYGNDKGCIIMFRKDEMQNEFEQVELCYECKLKFLNFAIQQLKMEMKAKEKQN